MASDSQISGEITTLLHRWSAGDVAALDDLIEIAYKELHSIAAGYLRQENRNQTLQATELVSELRPFPLLFLRGHVDAPDPQRL